MKSEIGVRYEFSETGVAPRKFVPDTNFGFHFIAAITIAVATVTFLA